MAQTVDSAWTAEEKASTRGIAHNLQISWKRELAGVSFTIGVSSIGGDDSIGANTGSVGSPGYYKYFDESQYALDLDWENQLNTPLGGLSKAIASGSLDNTSNRFLPDYMMGDSELFTAVLPRRPIIINGGFVVDGIDQTIPQFSGLFKRSPKIDVRSRTMGFDAEDYISYFESRFVDNTVLYTGTRSDVIIKELFDASGMSTAMYELDEGLNTIPFVIIPTGSSFSSVIDDIASAENGYVFQDEEGVFRFWNRHHFNSTPFNEVQRIIRTSQVIGYERPDEDSIINTVEITSDVYGKQANATIYELQSPVELNAGVNATVWINLEGGLLEVTGQTIAGNTQSDGSGSAITVNVIRRDEFADAIKYTLRSNTTGYVTQLDVTGRIASVIEEVYVRESLGASLTAYQEKKLTINNKYIQDRSWAYTYAITILEAYGLPDKTIKMTIRAIPELQRGDLLSWQGSLWRVFSIRGSIDPSSGYVQDLVIQKTNNEGYFTIGVSLIEGDDGIAA